VDHNGRVHSIPQETSHVGQSANSPFPGCFPLQDVDAKVVDGNRPNPKNASVNARITILFCRNQSRQPVHSDIRSSKHETREFRESKINFGASWSSARTCRCAINLHQPYQSGSCSESQGNDSFVDEARLFGGSLPSLEGCVHKAGWAYPYQIAAERSFVM